jgi:uncharacterized protein YfbU (UPF0304 family)
MYYAQHREAVEGGYTLQYDSIYDGLNDEMSREDCQEVIDILSMYRQLHFSYDQLGKPAEIDESQIKFLGFDGNNESKQYFYTQYFIVSLGRFSELRDGMESPDFNSHAEMLGKYQAMLPIWRRLGRRTHDLSMNEIRQLIEAD